MTVIVCGGGNITIVMMSLGTLLESPWTHLLLLTNAVEVAAVADDSKVECYGL